MFGGDIGIYTGFKEGIFSVSENDREIIHTLPSLLENVAMIFLGYDEISWITRQALIKCDTFQCAVNYLSTAPIIAPGYLTIAGTGRYEGAVISRDRNGAAHIEMLTEERWMLVQTNDDHFAGVCQTRCQVGNANMNAIGSANLNADNLRSNVMLQTPTLNDGTIFSAIMNPKLGLIDVFGINSDYPEPAR